MAVNWQKAVVPNISRNVSIKACCFWAHSTSVLTFDILGGNDSLHFYIARKEGGDEQARMFWQIAHVFFGGLAQWS